MCSVKLDRDRNSVMKKSDIEHMVNSSLLYAGFSTLYIFTYSNCCTYLNSNPKKINFVNCRPFLIILTPYVVTTCTVTNNGTLFSTLVIYRQVVFGVRQ